MLPVSVWYVGVLSARRGCALGRQPGPNCRGSQLAQQREATVPSLSRDAPSCGDVSESPSRQEHELPVPRRRPPGRPVGDSDHGREEEALGSLACGAFLGVGWPPSATWECRLPSTQPPPSLVPDFVLDVRYVSP